MLHCGKDPFNRALRGSSISLKVMAAGPLGKGPAAEHHYLELFIMTRLTELSGAAAGSPAERWDQRSADVASIVQRSEEHTSELQSLMRISYAVFCLKKKRSKKQ